MTAPTTYCDECGASNPLQATYCFACHTALQPPAPSPLLPVHTANAAMLLRETRGGLLPPSYLLHSRYSIVSQIGTGGFGAVYQAQDTLFSHRPVAIKEMSQGGLSPRELAEATAAFEREALVLTNLTHPNLPRIHDHFSEHGRSYVVMDFIAGGTLHQLLTGNDPSLSLFHFAPVRLYNSPISAPLNALLQQMLEMEMDKRPASMAVVKQELQRLLASQTAQKLSPVVKRRTFVKGCLGVVATCSASIAIATFIVKNPNLVDLLFAHPFSGTTPVPSPSPLAPAQATMLSRPLQTYRGHAGSVTAVAWSPHGQNIASASTLDSYIHVWDVNTGNLVLVPRKDKGALFATNNQSVDALAWSPNGSSIAAALGKDTVDIWSIETGDPSTIPFSQPGNANAQPGNVNAL